MLEGLHGHCAIIINPKGDVVAEATDFDGSHAAGISLENRQTSRVRNRVIRAFAKSHLNEWLAEKVDDYFANKFFEHAINCGYKLHIFPIGDTHD